MFENVSLFTNVPAELVEALGEYSKRRHYPKDSILFMEGDDSNHLYILESGRVRVFVSGEDGKQFVLNYLVAGDYFGELALIDGKPRSASVMTVADSVIVTISRDDFRRFITDNPDVALALMCQLVTRIRTLTDSARDLALLDVYGRVTRQLQQLSDDSGQISNPKLTHQEIANMVGASREMVSRIMKELVVGGYIEQLPGKLAIKKPLPAGW